MKMQTMIWNKSLKHFNLPFNQSINYLSKGKVAKIILIVGLIAKNSILIAKIILTVGLIAKIVF